MKNLPDLLPGVPFVESPLFKTAIDDLDLTAEERTAAIHLHERGYAVIEFPDHLLAERIERIKTRVSGHLGRDFEDPSVVKNTGEDLRLQDAWLIDEDIRAIAANQQILDLLRKLYGRPAIPFQTLNFPVGTQQHYHTDAIHFSSIPERFMCGVWLAMEDVGPDAGPLTYIPGSHRWPILNNALLGRRGYGQQDTLAQSPFEATWAAMIEASGIEPEVFLPRRGQALIWAANLLHGGSVQLNIKLTRWSQVTHYYFSDCIYYTPAFSDEALGLLDLRTITNIETGELEANSFLGTAIGEEVAPPKPLGKLRRLFSRQPSLPKGFDAKIYYLLNPDVARSRISAAQHYIAHGKQEGRRYKLENSAYSSS